MREFSALLLEIQDHLDNIQTSWCLIGGLAVGARTEPRFTKDLDLAVATPNDSASEELVFSLQARGYRVVAILEQQASGRLATVRLSPPGSAEPVIIDLLFASSGIEADVVARAEPVTVFPNAELCLANPGTDTVLVYPRTATGVDAPTRTITGGSTGLATPRDVLITTAP